MFNIQTPVILYLYYPNHHSAKIFLFLSEFSFMNNFDSQGSRGRGGYLFISSLSIPLAPKTFRQLVDCCRELTSPHSKQTQSPRSNKNKKTSNKQKRLWKKQIIIWLASINDMTFCNSSFTSYYILYVNIYFMEASS